MKIYIVRQQASRAVLWVGSAVDADNALDAMAHEAGFRTSQDLPGSVTAGGLIAEPLSF